MAMVGVVVMVRLPSSMHLICITFLDLSLREIIVRRRSRLILKARDEIYLLEIWCRNIYG